MLDHAGRGVDRRPCPAHRVAQPRAGEGRRRRDAARGRPGPGRGRGACRSRPAPAGVTGSAAVVADGCPRRCSRSPGRSARSGRPPPPACSSPRSPRRCRRRRGATAARCVGAGLPLQAPASTLTAAPILPVPLSFGAVTSAGATPFTLSLEAHRGAAARVRRRHRDRGRREQRRGRDADHAGRGVDRRPCPAHRVAQARAGEGRRRRDAAAASPRIELQVGERAARHRRRPGRPAAPSSSPTALPAALLAVTRQVSAVRSSAATGV